MKKFLLIVTLIIFAFSAVNGYAQEEEKLKPEEAEELIQKLSEQEMELKNQLDNLKQEIASLEEEISSLKMEVTDLENQKEKCMEKYEAMKWYTVKDGDWLAKIAENVYGMGEADRWREIYQANKDKIKDPDLLLPGWKLRIPRP